MSPNGATAGRWRRVMATLKMSQKERKRLVVMNEVQQGKLKLVQAAEVMGLSYRQAKRVWKRFGQAGDAGLVHRSRGRPSGRSKQAELRQQVLRRYAQAYPDFGPTLAAEKLAAEGLVIDHETLRRWLLTQGIWTVRRRRQKHRQWRERKAAFGQMVQLDGSHHDWFEGRRGSCVLMVMVDDATNHTGAQFFEAETTHASYDVLESWVRQQGVPQSLYVDRDSIYRCEGQPSLEEQLAGKEPQTQFGRAMECLGIELILANSPQAKGRVERRNGLLQDRLVKELRLRQICDLASANAFLQGEFLEELNRRFRVTPASPADLHRPVPRELNEVLSWEEQRVVNRDWTVSWRGRWLQITRHEGHRALVGRKVTVRRLRQGTLQLLWRNHKLRWRELPQRPARAKVLSKPNPVRAKLRPAQNHPWRKFAAAKVRKNEQRARAQQRPSPGALSLRRGPRPKVRYASAHGGSTPSRTAARTSHNK